MRANQLGVQAHCLRSEIAADLDRTLARVAELGIAALEMMSFPGSRWRWPTAPKCSQRSGAVSTTFGATASSRRDPRRRTPPRHQYPRNEGRRFPAAVVKRS